MSHVAPGRAKITEKHPADRIGGGSPPLLTFVGLLVAWISYATVRVFMQKYYWGATNPEQTFLHYLTPFYSPCVSDGLHPRASGEFGTFLPDVWWLPYAALTLPFLLLFRHDVLLLPQGVLPRRSGCRRPRAQSPSRTRKYTGETQASRSCMGQNLHRYFFYAAVGHLADQHLRRRRSRSTVRTAVLRDRPGHRDPLDQRDHALWAYTVVVPLVPTALIGGRLTHFSKHPVRYKPLDAGVEAQHQAHMQPRLGHALGRSPSLTST